jgi:hypothetical protein
MISQILAIVGAILVAVTSVFLIVSVDWRMSVVGLAVQYVGVFALVSAGWPISLALVKLVAGWMSGAILSMALSGMPPQTAINMVGEEILQSNRGWLHFRSGRLFRLFTIGMIGLLVLSVSPSITTLFPMLKLEQAIGASFLLGMGMLQLSLTAQPLRVILGLLTVLSGFEVVYSGVETSTLVTGLLAGVNLGVALVGAYLFVNQLGEPVP